jgi:hypothetical protein
MKLLDKIRNYFFCRKINVKNTYDIKEINSGRYNASIYSKLPLMKKYCVWSTYVKDINSANETISNAYKNKMIVKDEISLVEYINRIWYYLKYYWLNIIDIINDECDIIKHSKGVFKKPIKKWYFGCGIEKCVFKPYNSDYINPILYINNWSISWKPKYDYVCFEDNQQVWICLFKFFWVGYKLISPVKEVFEDSYWEQMIWYVNYSDCDLKKAEETYFGKWDKKYLL